MKYEEIVHRCFRCGYCKFTGDYSTFNCPSYRKFGFDTYSPGGRMWLIRAWLAGEIENTTRLQHILFSCATCASCVEHCVFTFSDDLVNAFVAAREEMVNGGIIPPRVRDYLKSIHINGNPYRAPGEERDKWAERMSVLPYDGQEYLFYVGCVGSYDERAQKIARSVTDLLLNAGVSFGILGKREICDGNEVRALGERGLFQSLAEQNIALFRELGIQRIITLDPHAFNAFKNDYPELGGHYQVFHYSQVLAPLLRGEAMPFRELRARVTYHDPCYLGRHNGEYTAPRIILRSIPGLDLVEMEQSRENAFCCGGGGGNFFTDILGGGEESPARVRIRQALDTGAEILAVSCPQCAKMLDDALKAENAAEKMKVLDVSEIASLALPQSQDSCSNGLSP
ncbi:MAG: (Fe-S)-binding protein [Deltaproteobacteria bacterium]|nr:(Fe-S)-binding protein [Deltaproteobacteria bacterium]MBW1934661.1 (Fe-S)-binding protein [Deltaproteobacteria bacterium]